jgi:hypothetical protein
VDRLEMDVYRASFLAFRLCEQSLDSPV